MNIADDLTASILSHNYIHSEAKECKKLQNKQEIDFFQNTEGYIIKLDAQQIKDDDV
jgi:hypothetical protein